MGGQKVADIRKIVSRGLGLRPLGYRSVVKPLGLISEHKVARVCMWALSGLGCTGLVAGGFWPLPFWLRVSSRRLPFLDFFLFLPDFGIRVVSSESVRSRGKSSSFCGNGPSIHGDGGTRSGSWTGACARARRQCDFRFRSRRRLRLVHNLGVRGSGLLPLTIGRFVV